MRNGGVLIIALVVLALVVAVAALTSCGTADDPATNCPGRAAC